METLWLAMVDGWVGNTLDVQQARIYRQLVKALSLLESNPRHNGLKTHEIEPLSRRMGMKVFQSYLSNRTPASGRFYWVYGPGKQEITIIGLEPHPEDSKSKGYAKVRLSSLPE